MAKQQFIEGEIAVEGLAALNRSLRQVDAQLPKEIKGEFHKVATVVAARTAGSIPKQTGTMAASVKPRSSANYAAIAAYGAKVPYGRYVDFGGAIKHARGVRPGGHGGETRRPFISVGRFVYPTIYKMRDENLEAAEQAVDTVLKKV